VDREFATLEKDIPAWAASEGYTTESDFYPQANIIAMRITLATPPNEFGVRVGNIVHSLRSALDYLVSDLAVLNGCEPVEGPRGNQFPIFSKPPITRKGEPVQFAIKTLRGVLAGVHPIHASMIEAFQPYWPENQIEGVPNPFEMLTDLSNTDKHRVLHTLASGAIMGKSVGLTGVVECDVKEILHFQPILQGPHLKAGTVVACAEIVPNGPEPKMYVEALFPLQLIFEDELSVMKCLFSIKESVRALLVWFKPLFAGEPIGEPPRLSPFPT